MMDYVERETKLENNCHKSYALIFGQCTKHLRSKIEANKDYHRIRGEHGMFLLMVAINGINFKLDVHKHPLYATNDAKRDF